MPEVTYLTSEERELIQLEINGHRQIQAGHAMLARALEKKLGDTSTRQQRRDLAQGVERSR